MKLPTEASPYLIEQHENFMKQARLICHAEYAAAGHTFRMPLILFPKEKSTFTLTGFRSAAGVPAEPIKLEYQVSDEALSKADREKFEAEGKNPRLLALLKSMQGERAKLTSLAERVQTLSLSQRDGLFTSLTAQSASFKWQKPDRFYGDVTDIMGMCSAFVIGCDGQNWWWHAESAHGTKLVLCPVKAMQRLDISFATRLISGIKRLGRPRPS
jgi:hypothetical protein